jgi:hypothetical protein
MTIGRNCYVPLGGDGPGRCWTGNVWVKKGGSTYGNGKGEFAGDKHTFVRTDNQDDKAKIAQYCYMSKASQDITLRLAIAEKAAQKLKQRGIPVRSLPADFAIPLLRECGDAEDPNLQEWWAELLASSVADESLCHVAFVHTLQSMSPADVKFLDALLQIGPGDPKEKWGLFKQATGFSANQINICVHVLDKLGFFMVGSQFRLRGFAFDFLRTCCAQPDRIAAYKEEQSKLPVKLLVT